MRYSNTEITQIYERHLSMVYRVCFLYLKNSADTEDAVQNVFIKLINTTKPFKNDEHEKAWLIRCATNHCKDVLKSAYKKRTDFDISEDIPDKESEDSHEDLLEALMKLPDKYKDCIYLHYYEGYKTDEIAALLNKPGSTIRSHLSEARELLRETLGGESA